MSEVPFRVVKFGGSITGSGPRLGEAADRLLELRDAPILVVASAPGEITDEMLALLHEGGVPSEDAGALGPLWRAEQIGAELLASAIRVRGGRVRLLQPDDRDWPVVLASPTFGAAVDLPETRERFARLARDPDRAPITVMPGFVGLDSRGRPGTLARGGGDTTAVLAARCLGASEVLLVKDVPGILPADPRVLPGAAPLAEVSREELELLSRGGAPVVALEALAYLPEELPIRVVGLSEGLAAGHGTVVRSGRTGPARPGAPRGRAGRGGSTPAPEASEEWAIVTALPARASERGGAVGLPWATDPGAPPIHAVSWVTERSRADDLVRQAVASGAFRAASQRPLDRLARPGEAGNGTPAEAAGEPTLPTVRGRP